MSEKNIYILSMPIQSGKTTGLKSWLGNKQKKTVSGFLTPDINGKRKVLELPENNIVDFEVAEAGNDIVNIGKFYFKNTVFKSLKQAFNNYIYSKPDWIVIDEIGPLEINKNDGFEPEFSSLVNQVKHAGSKTKLLVVVRSSMLFDFLEKYELKNDALVFNRSFFLLHS